MSHKSIAHRIGHLWKRIISIVEERCWARGWCFDCLEVPNLQIFKSSQFHSSIQWSVVIFCLLCSTIASTSFKSFKASSGEIPSTRIPKQARATARKVYVTLGALMRSCEIRCPKASRSSTFPREAIKVPLLPEILRCRKKPGYLIMGHGWCARSWHSGVKLGN